MFSNRSSSRWDNNLCKPIIAFSMQRYIHLQRMLSICVNLANVLTIHLSLLHGVQRRMISADNFFCSF